MKEREVEEGSALYQAAAFEGLASNAAYDDEERLKFALRAIEWLHKALDELEEEK
jgi:hypothetical protein